MDSPEYIMEQGEILAQRFKAQKFESLRVLAGGMAHDFNNLMAVILGNVSLARMDRNLSEKTSRALKEAEAACQMAACLTSRLIESFNGGTPVTRVEALEEIVEGALEEGLAGLPVQCEVVVGSGLWPVQCDAKQARKALAIVILNAREAIRNGGCIEVTAKNVSLGEGQIPSLQEGKYVKISVRDTGVGIAAEHLPKVFDPYFSTKERSVQKGMGLGLTIAYAILNSHDGHIEMESQAGVGTVAHIFLPAAAPLIQQPPPPA